MKQEQIKSLAFELAGILQREKKTLTRDQLFTRCSDGVNYEDVIDAATLLCKKDFARAIDGGYRFIKEPMLGDLDSPVREEAKPEADMPSPAIVPAPTLTGREIEPHEYIRHAHPDSVDHETVQQAKTAQEVFAGMRRQSEEMVNRPPHYTYGQIEIIDAIEDWQLGFCLGNAIKYIARHRHKGTALQDLKKAAWYLQREIARLEKSAQ